MFNAYNPRATSAYQRINVETSMHTIDQHQLVSLLYGGVMDAITSARGALARGDVPLKCNSISKAIRILEEGLRIFHFITPPRLFFSGSHRYGIV